MEPIQYNWNTDGRGHALVLAFVAVTHGHPYLFGEGRLTRPIEIHDFLIGTVPVTQALWAHVTGTNANPRVHRDEDLPVIPQDGRAYVGPGEERVLRGGCFRNWAIHCTVSKRYEIAHDYADGAIGFRPVFSA